MHAAILCHLMTVRPTRRRRAVPDRLGTSNRAGVVLAGVVLGAVVWSTGCATPGPTQGLPFGEWSGEGTFTYQSWVEADGGGEEIVKPSIQRSYPTSLSIRPGQIDGRDVIEVEILSERGKFDDNDDDDRTHLRVALAETSRGADGNVLYRLVSFRYNPSPGSEPGFDDHYPPCTAWCTKVGNATVLQIGYLESFFDTIRFEGRRVEKQGIYVDEDAGFIGWTEQLTRTK